MILRIDRTVQTAQGQAVSGALFYVLTQPANVGALTPLATLYADLAGTPAPNPAVTDGLGQVALYLDNGQLYTFVVVSTLISTMVYPDQNLSGGGAGSYSTFSQVPVGAVDGVNRVFTLGVVPQLLLQTLNGLLLTPGLGYTLAGSTITFATAPQVGDNLFSQGIVASGATPFTQVPTGTIDGVNRVFTLAVTPVLLFFSWDGVTLTPGVGYTTAVVAGVYTITMQTAPGVGDTLFAQGIH